MSRPIKLKFAGEDKFIVGRGGKKKYLMMTANNGEVLTIEPAPIDEQPTDVLNPPILGEVPTTPPIIPPTKTEQPVPTDVVLFPDWAMLTCADIRKAIDRELKPALLTIKNETLLAEYQKQIDLGEQFYLSKGCAAPAPPPPPPPGIPPSTTTITTTGVPIIATTTSGGLRPLGGIGGGGGGRAVEEPPMEKKPFPWWILVVVAGVYLIAKRSN